MKKRRAFFAEWHNYITGKEKWKNGICKWKNCTISEITEKEMLECGWNNDCENCEMNTVSSSYDCDIVND